MFHDWCNMEKKTILFLFCYQVIASFISLHFIFVVLNTPKFKVIQLESMFLRPTPNFMYICSAIWIFFLVQRHVMMFKSEIMVFMGFNFTFVFWLPFFIITNFILFTHVSCCWFKWTNIIGHYWLLILSFWFKFYKTNLWCLSWISCNCSLHLSHYT
jgi:hypothetical protein